MLLWFVFAVMTVLATIAVLWPLARRQRTPALAAHDLAVYRDQLEELQRDRERGLIGEAEAEAARTEIARRALKAGDAVESETAPRRSFARPAAILAVIAVPAISLAVYLQTGSPDLPAQPLEARLADAGEDDVAALVARVERHLAANPDDAAGWRVLAPVYARLGRFTEAAEALRQVIRIDGPAPDLHEDRGEMLVAANEGLVGADAEAAFAAALAAEPGRAKARYYRALGHLQSGRPEEAIADYDEILRTSPADAPWTEAVKRDRATAQAALGAPLLSAPSPAPGPGVGPGPDAVAAAADMSEAERASMIEGMVEGLAERLKAEPGDAEGWQRLIRAYGVLGRTEDAAAAFRTASATFADAPDQLSAIRQVAAEAGIAVE